MYGYHLVYPYTCILLTLHPGSDGHLGVYPGSWLLTHQNDFTKKQDTAVAPPAFPPRYSDPVVTSYNSYFANSSLLVRDFKAWRPDSTNDEKYPTVQYDKVMENDRSLCEWLEKIVSCPCNGLFFWES